jgi:hypothetical protein
MKKYIYLFLTIASLGVVSCDDRNQDLLTGDKNEGGLLTIKNILVPYVVGNGNDFEYKASISAFQGDVKVQTVDIYKTFTNVDGVSSNTALLKTVTFPVAAQVENLDFTATYNELIANLVIDGVALSSDDSNLNIGDYWTLKYVSRTSTGASTENLKTTKVAVGTRFAGQYNVVQCEYWRIGVIRPDVTGPFLGTVVTIESVKAPTYRKLEYCGPFSGNEFYFTIDSSDNVLVPTLYNGEAQLLNALPAINCSETPADMTNACNFAGIQNKAVRDDVDGKDRIYMSYGYLLAGSGPREFYEVLEKVVE